MSAMVSYATGALSDLRLRAFRGRSSLPSLCYRTGRSSVAALLCEIPATNADGRGGVKRSRLLDLLSLTQRRWHELRHAACERPTWPTPSREQTVAAAVSAATGYLTPHQEERSLYLVWYLGAMQAKLGISGRVLANRFERARSATTAIAYCPMFC